jgi:nicotinate-nucleotide adenylyltransferase
MNNAPQKIGIVGGSFDPPHLGHLLLAQDATEFLALDKVLFIPTAATALKAHAPLASAPLRLAMLQAAIAGHPAWEVSDWEILQGGTSYSLHTAQHLRTLYPDAELYWLIGADQLRQLHRWYRATELFRLVRFAVADRNTPPSPAAPADNKAAATAFTCAAGSVASPAPASAQPPPDAHITTLPCRNVDISSTEIRNRLHTGRPVDLFLPEGVHRIIQRESLYR